MNSLSQPKASQLQVATCTGCGSQERSDTDTFGDEEFQGYTRCCNEPVEYRAPIQY